MARECEWAIVRTVKLHARQRNMVRFCLVFVAFDLALAYWTRGTPLLVLGAIQTGLLLHGWWNGRRQLRLLARLAYERALIQQQLELEAERRARG